MVRLEGERAYSLDLDDTLVNRRAVIRWLSAMNAKRKPTSLPSISLDELPTVIVEPADEPLQGIKEKISYVGHKNRKILPGVKAALENARVDGIALYGNTGRPNKKIWAEMTHSTLEKGGVADLIENVYFTPDSIKAAVNKAAVVYELRRHHTSVEHFDDDPATVLFLARLFPDSIINLVQRGPTGLLFSQREYAKFPNIKRVAVIGEAMQEREV